MLAIRIKIQINPPSNNAKIDIMASKTSIKMQTKLIRRQLDTLDEYVEYLDKANIDTLYTRLTHIKDDTAHLERILNESFTNISLITLN